MFYMLTSRQSRPLVRLNGWSCQRTCSVKKRETFRRKKKLQGNENMAWDSRN